MPCTRPLTAYKDAEGRVTFDESEGAGPPFALKCGNCQQCRLQHAADWATRITHEARLHERSSFLTLTYADDQIPEDGGLSKRDVQLFLKRARQELGPLRYYLAGEYGPKTERPHYHACLFGHDFHEDREFLYKNHQGDPVYKSDWLDWIWRKGGCQIGSLTEQSASYVARYCMSKANNKSAFEKYKRSDGITTWHVEPERAFMSLKPGIGAGWFTQFGHTDVFPIDELVLDGSRRHVPRYYDKLWERQGGDLAAVKAKREQRAERNAEDLTTERLAVRERVTAARLSRLQRSSH